MILRAVSAFVGLVLVASGPVSATAAAGSPVVADAAAAATVAQTATPIQHFIVLMQANHSFDNYFGTYPGADGIQTGVCLRVNTSQSSETGCVQPFPLGNRPPEDLDHGTSTQRRQYDGGRMDGFISAYRTRGQDGTTAMGYYNGSDLPYYWNLADQYVLFDKFFSSASTGSRLNHFYWVTGGPTPSGSERVPKGGYGNIPTIFDRLEASGVTWKFYIENYDPKVTFRSPGTGPTQNQLTKVPLLNYARFVDDPKLFGHIADLSEYYKDLQNGTLPAVSYMVAAGSSENPPGSPQAGQRLVRQLTSELTKSSYWPSSAFMLTYDGWGGWYDHVAPPTVDQYGDGFRVPTLLVSPYARRGFVDSTQLDYTAIPKFIEDNWGLAPMAKRDAESQGLASAFDFSASPRPAQLISLSRTTVPVKSVTTKVIYGLYGAGVAVALLVLVIAFWRRQIVGEPSM